MDVVIFGTGQLSEVISFYIENDTQDTIVAYTVDAAYKENDTFNNKPVITWEALQQFMANKPNTRLLCPLSYKNLNENRKQKYLEAKRWGVSFYSYIHSSSFVNSKELGDNLIVLENCRIQPFSKIGNNCTIWSDTHIGHHAKIDDHCFFAGSGGVAGSTHIGECTFIGGTAVIGDNLNIGSHCIIGAGASITSDLNPYSVAVPPKTRVLNNAAKRFSKAF